MPNLTEQFIITDRQKEIISKIDKLIPLFYERSQEIDEKGAFPYQNIEELKQIRYPKLTVPTEYGGDEISLYDFVLFQERLAQGDGSTALAIGWHVGIMMDLATNRPWQEDLFKKVCKDVVQNGALLNSAASEPKTGSPTRGGRPETTATKHENGWLINGRKTFTTMSPVLDYFLVTATVEDTGEVGQFLIPKNVNGVDVHETWDSISMKGTGSHDLILEQVHIPEEYLLEMKTNGKPKASGWLLHIPACYLGIAIAARDFAVNFTRTYSPNSISGTISELPNIQRHIGEIELELLAARHFLYSVARKWDEHPLQRAGMAAELGSAKVVATNTAISIVDKAMRITGARSLLRTNPLQRYYRDVRAGLHNPPMDDAVITMLSKQAIMSDTE